MIACAFYNVAILQFYVTKICNSTKLHLYYNEDVTNLNFTMLHISTFNIRLQSHTFTMLHLYLYTMLQIYTFTTPQCYITLLQLYVTPLQLYKCTTFTLLLTKLQL